VGTLQLLEPDERARVKGVVFNKFRGDVELLKPGLKMLEDIAGVPTVGVVPYFHDIHIDAEDSVCIERVQSTPVEGAVDVAVIRLPRISNFTDFDALASEPGVTLRYVLNTDQFGKPDMVIIPGTKNTCGDLDWLRQHDLANAIAAHARAGGRVAGICGGFQMLGREIHDPDLVEASTPTVDGLGLLSVTTTFLPEKTTHQATATVHPDAPDGFRALAAGALRGYEIHMGVTALDAGAPLMVIETRSGEPAGEPDGAVSADGRVWGTYMHGIFDNDEFRFALINSLRQDKGLPPLPRDELRSAAERKEAGYDKLADLLDECLDMDAVWSMIGGRPR